MYPSQRPTACPTDFTTAATHPLTIPKGVSLKLGNTLIEDTFAEAFRMVYARLWITAHDAHWLDGIAGELEPNDA